MGEIVALFVAPRAISARVIGADDVAAKGGSCRVRGDCDEARYAVVLWSDSCVGGDLGSCTRGVGWRSCSAGATLGNVLLCELFNVSVGKWLALRGLRWAEAAAAAAAG